MSTSAMESFERFIAQPHTPHGSSIECSLSPPPLSMACAVFFLNRIFSAKCQRRCDSGRKLVKSLLPAGPSHSRELRGIMRGGLSRLVIAATCLLFSGVYTDRVGAGAGAGMAFSMESATAVRLSASAAGCAEAAPATSQKGRHLTLRFRNTLINAAMREFCTGSR